MYLASLVDMVLLRCILTVVIVAGIVDLFPSCSSLSPPMVTLTLFLSTFNGLMEVGELCIFVVWENQNFHDLLG